MNTEQAKESGQTAELRSSGWLGSFVSFVIFGAIMLPLLWEVSGRVNEPWAYTMRGVALMLWPCQWAFWLGQKSRSLPNAGDVPRADKKN